jgi:hypothetical protein
MNLIPTDWKLLEPFWYWINERHSIYLKRQAGDAWPWTEDKILQEYSFCNVFRELDTVTEWIRVNWREPYADHPNLWFAMCVARQINWPPSLEEIGFPGTYKSSYSVAKPYPHDEDLAINMWKECAIANLEERKGRGEKVYTGAYMIRAEQWRPEQSKIRYTFDKVLMPVWDPDSIAGTFPFGSIQETTEWLESFYGWGGFMAYEVATDLRHTRYLNSAPDIMTWAQPGPGARRGLNRLFGRPLTQSIKRQQCIDEMRMLLDMSPKWIGTHVPDLEMRDVEHSLCECDKYLRVKNGEGRPRAKYHVGHEKEY